MTDMSKVQANRDALKKEYVEVLAANEELAKTLRQLQTYPKEEKLKLEERIRQLQESLREEEKARGDLEGRLILEEKFHEEHQVNLQKKEDLLVQCRQDREKHEDEVMDLQVKRKEMEKHSKVNHKLFVYKRLAIPPGYRCDLCKVGHCTILEN